MKGGVLQYKVRSWVDDVRVGVSGVSLGVHRTRPWGSLEGVPRRGLGLGVGQWAEIFFSTSHTTAVLWR